MIVLLFAFALTIGPQPVRVELVEVNHYHDAAGEHVFDQLIFYRWSEQRRRYDVCEWRLIKSESMLPKRKGNGWFLRWHDDGVLREVEIRSVRETHTTYDREVLERAYLPQDQRRAVLPVVQMGVEL